MIELSAETFTGIDCLHATPSGQQDHPLPTVIFYHGFTSSKEVYAYFAVALAQAGFRVVMPDASQHGARYDGDAQARLGHFWGILKTTIDELPALEAALREKGLIDKDRLAVAGASMGGMTAIGAMTRYPHLSCVACLMGSGYFMSLSHHLFPPLAANNEQPSEVEAQVAPLAACDVSHQLEKIADRPLLVWHGDADELVPAAESVRLASALREAKIDRHLTFIIEQGVGHRITPLALAETVAFFRSHL
ncbi:esterase [Erwinia tasmaniensis]|uniref:esterase n=1 Tax=Erwinia tasmaniensis TaxID=338565 RepID=UPI003A4E4A3B